MQYELQTVVVFLGRRAYMNKDACIKTQDLHVLSEFLSYAASF